MKLGITLLFPVVCSLVFYAFSINAEFARREIRISDLERREERFASALIRIEEKIDDLKDLLIRKDE